MRCTYKSRMLCVGAEEVYRCSRLVSHLPPSPFFRPSLPLLSPSSCLLTDPAVEPLCAPAALLHGVGPVVGAGELSPLVKVLAAGQLGRHAQIGAGG